MSDEGENDDDGRGGGIGSILAQVIRDSKVPAKGRAADIKPAVRALGAHAYEHGLLPDELTQLVQLVTTPSQLDQASLGSIIRNLYPTSAVGGEDVIRLVGSLGHGALKAPLSIQAALLRWLIMVYHAVDGQDSLSRCYLVLFNLLDTAAIRPLLCHLLALITRRRHVRPYRIQALLSLSRQTGNDPAVIGLLRVYKDYYPDIIVGEATRGRAAAFKHPDPQWRERVDQIQRAHVQRGQDADRPRHPFRVSRLAQANGPGKAPVVPQVRTSHAQEDSVTLEEMDSVDGLVQGLERIRLPNQLIAVLADPLLQKLMLLRPDTESDLRATNWLRSYAQDLTGGEGGAELDGLLRVLVAYAQSTKPGKQNLPGVVVAFLVRYLDIWDGQECRDVMLELISWLPLPSDDPTGTGVGRQYRDVLAALEARVLDGSTRSQLEILQSYTGLLRNWTVRLLVQQDAGSGSGSANASASANANAPQTAASDLIGHVNQLCLSLVQSSASIATHHAVLDFYEQCAHLAACCGCVVIPPRPLVYMLHFSLSAATVSRLCGVLARYKEGLQKAVAQSSSPSSSLSVAAATAQVGVFNGFLMDICNCLWRSKAFNPDDANAHACLMPAATAAQLAAHLDSVETGIGLGAAFGLTLSPALSLLAVSLLRQLEELEMAHDPDGLPVRHAGPPTRHSLLKLARRGGLNISWTEFRLGLMRDLERRGLAGIGQLMSVTMIGLAKGKERMG